MVTSTLPSIEQRIPAMAAHIHRAIPGCEVRLFGSRAQGSAGPDADIDLLITVPDDWMQCHHRFQVLGDLWGTLAHRSGLGLMPDPSSGEPALAVGDFYLDRLSGQVDELSA